MIPSENELTTTKRRRSCSPCDSSPTLTFSESPRPGTWREKSRTSSSWSEFNLHSHSRRTHSGTDSDDSIVGYDSKSQMESFKLPAQPVCNGSNMANTSREEAAELTDASSSSPSLDQTAMANDRLSPSRLVPSTTPHINHFSTFLLYLRRVCSSLVSCTTCSTCTSMAVVDNIPSPLPNRPIQQQPLPPLINHISGTGALDDPLVFRIVVANDETQDSVEGRRTTLSPHPGVNPASPLGLASRVGSWEERREARAARRRFHLHDGL